MKTPYDAAMRLRQREIDDMRASIIVVVDQMTVLAEQRDAIDTAVRAEAVIASNQHVFPAHAFLARMQAERETLSRERAASDARLNDLRTQAVEVYGSFSALGSAADRHRAEMLRAASIVEQGQVDDFSAARFTRTLHAARRSREAQAGKA